MHRNGGGEQDFRFLWIFRRDAGDARGNPFQFRLRDRYCVRAKRGRLRPNAPCKRAAIAFASVHAANRCARAIPQQLNCDEVCSVNGRPFTRADYLALKSAFRRDCEDAGPLHKIAENTRADAALLSRYGNPERGENAPIDVLLDVGHLSGMFRTLKQAAELAGFDLVPRHPEKIASESMLRHLGQVGSSHGDLQSSMCDALADGKVTPTEATEIQSKAEDHIDNVEHLTRDALRIRAAG